MASATNISATEAPPGARAAVAEGGFPARTRLVTKRFGSGPLGSALLLANSVALLILAAGALGIANMRNAVIEERLELLERQAITVRAVLTDPALSPCTKTSCISRPGEAQAILERLGRGFDGSLVLYRNDNGEPFFLTRYDPPGSRARVDAVPVPSSLPANALPDRVAGGAEALLQQVLFDWPLRGRFSQLTPDEQLAAILRGDGVAGDSLRPLGGSVLHAAVTLPLLENGRITGILVAEHRGTALLGPMAERALLPFVASLFLIASLSALALSRAVTQPLRDLSQAAEKIRSSVGQAETVRMPNLDHRRDEVGRLSRSFRAMTEALVERIQAIDSFAADVAHELKNPLTSIRSAAETIERCKTDEQRTRLLAVIANDVERMDRLISDISSASRLDAQLATEKRRTLGASKLVGDIARSYRAVTEAGGPIVSFWDETDASAILYGAPASLGRVLRNLIDNAISFSPKSGAVTVALEKSPRSRQLVLISVSDEGPGVPEDNLESIFGRFYTSRPSGATFGANSGLGLAIARQIVESHGGRIWCENVQSEDPDRTGGRFMVELPTHKAPALS
jgi:two-component system sensor histidine kinase ChvG